MPFNFAPTEVMTLGSVRPMRVGDFYTQPPNQFLNPPRTTSSFPQNLVRQTLNGLGLGRLSAVALGDLPAAVPATVSSQSADPTASSALPTPPTYGESPSTHYELSPVTAVALGTISTASALVSLYHGYKRNNSLGWALLWGLMGATFPLITPTVALAQGYAVRKHRGRA